MPDLITSGWRDYLAGRIPFSQVQARQPALPTWLCPQTNQSYQATPIQIEALGGLRFAWVRCTCCDASGRAADSPDYDADNPQIHVHKLEALPCTS